MLPPRRTTLGKPRSPATASRSDAKAAGSLRIIAGTLRGSRLAVADRVGLRPTPERVRETLFNWLVPLIDGTRCLDLFAGTGALGIEALSRGAAEVVFVERDAQLAANLRANLLRLRQAARVECADAPAWLERSDASGADGAFDLVFLDPPFAADQWTAVAQRLQARGLLKPGALVYVECPADAAPSLPANGLAHREGRAGDVRFALYRVADVLPV
jgi:16S rRNA (guanine966-N2)-methyltransferase